MVKTMKGYPKNIGVDRWGIQFNLFSEKEGGEHLGSFNTGYSKETWNKLSSNKKISIIPIKTLELPRDSEGVNYIRKQVKIK